MTLVISKGLTLDNGTRAAAIAGVSPTLDYRFAREKREIETVSLTDKLTYTGGNGTFVGSDGFIQPATTNVPRFDHDPLSRQSLGLLSEVERTNLLLQSENFSITWAAVGSAPTLSAAAAIAPNGTQTATQITFAAADSRIRQIVLTTSGTTYTLTVYAKAVGSALNKIRLAFFDGVNQFVSGDFVISDTTWTRLQFTATSTTTSSAGQFQIRNELSSANANDFYIWGAQLEAASTPSSYIPTTTTAVTRTADSAVIDGTGVLTGTYTMVEKPEGCAVVSGTNINLQPGFTAERVMVFPAALDAGQITAIRGAM
jgi:hypothetical protein